LAPVCLDDSEHLELASPYTTEVNPDTVAFAYLAAGSSITATLLHVKYGTYKGQRTGLIVFQSDFVFPAEASRTTSAKIKIKFLQSEDPSVPAKLPKIVHREPGMLDGAPTESGIHYAFHADVTLQPPTPGNFGSINVGASKENSFTRTHYTTIRSSIMPHSDSRIGRQCQNTVVWSLMENEIQKRGVPPTFKGAIFVQLPPEEDANSQFYAQFRIEAKQACDIRQMYASLVQIFGGNKELVRFDSKVDFQADGWPDRLEAIDLSQLLKLPTIGALPPGY
jgi:hypothetical protein